MSTTIPTRDARNIPDAPILDQGKWKVPVVVDPCTVIYRDATDEEIEKAQAEAEATAAVLAAARPKPKKPGKGDAAPSAVDPATGTEF